MERDDLRRFACKVRGSGWGSVREYWEGAGWGGEGERGAG